jgi:hypothetical protein
MPAAKISRTNIQVDNSIWNNLKVGAIFAQYPASQIVISLYLLEPRF